MIRYLRSAFPLALLLPLSVALTGCGAGQKQPKWPEAAKKWFDRAEHSYQVGDLDDARLASENALAALPNEAEVRIVAAKIAMAELEFDRALQLLEGVAGTDAAGLRGRCHWYVGNLELAAEELAVVAGDPDVKDPWAKSALQLSRSGLGRRPFEMSGGLVSVVDMPRAGNTAMLVPVEINGEESLAMIATDHAECIIDGRTPGWVSLRFAGQVEVSDVPAMAQDLSGLTREIGAPVKMLLGVHLLRKVRATIDLSGRQFVVRNYEPPAPPHATTIAPVFYKGGALVIPGAFGVKRTAPTASLLMNTSVTFPLALDEAGWKKAGRDPNTLVAVPGAPDLRHGTIPMLRLGAFEIPEIPGVIGLPIDEIEQEVGVDLDGLAGSGLFATFRLTFADRGKTMWMEDLPPEVIAERQALLERLRAEAEQKAQQSTGPAASSTDVPEATTPEATSPQSSKP